MAQLEQATIAIHGDADRAAQDERSGDVAPPMHLSTTFSRPVSASPLLGADGAAGGDGAGKKNKKKKFWKSGGGHTKPEAEEGIPLSLVPAGGDMYNSGSSGQFVYARADQPTRARVESLLCALEGAGSSDTDQDGQSSGVAAGAVAYSSGMAAISALLLRTLPRRVALDNGYAATRDALESYRRIIAGPLLRRAPGKVPFEVISLEELRAELDAADRAKKKKLKARSKRKQKHQKDDSSAEGGESSGSEESSEDEPVGVDLILIETPRNPDTRLLDVEDIAKLATRCGPQKAMLAVDSTFASPIGFRPLRFGADFVIQSATKILGGHSDIMGGVLIARDAGHYGRLLSERTTSGAFMGAMECWLLLRSLRTLPLRVERAGESCLKIAEWLEGEMKSASSSGHEEVSGSEKKGRKGGNQNGAAGDGALTAARVVSVSHCFLKSHPDHALAKRQLDAPPYCLAFELESPVHAEHLADFTRLFSNATSLGGCESLLDWRKRFDADISPKLVRMSVGLEAPKDLIQDLKQALEKVARAWPV